MKKQLTLFLLLLWTISLVAQKIDFTKAQAVQQKNNVSLTLGGNGLFLSASYDRIISVKPGFFVDASAGIGIIPGVAGPVIPHQVIFNLGKKSSFLELGLGGTYEWHKTDASGFTETESSYHLSPIVGWKKIFKSHLLLCIYANPMIHIFGVYIYENRGILPYGGISFGYSF